MNGLIEREKLQKLAKEAVDHFREQFIQRKEKTLAELAQREYGFFFKKKRGEEWARAHFGQSSFEGGSNSGVYWKEYRWLKIAEDLLEKSTIGEVTKFILDEDELNVIWAVAEEVE